MKLAVIMMFIGLMISPSISYAQVPPDSVIVMTLEEHTQLMNDIQIMMEMDSINLLIIKEQTQQIASLNSLLVQDSLLVHFKDFRIGLLEDEIGLYKDKVDDLADTSWKNNKGVWASVGAAGMVLASWIVKNVGGAE